MYFNFLEVPSLTLFETDRLILAQTIDNEKTFNPKVNMQVHFQPSGDCNQKPQPALSPFLGITNTHLTAAQMEEITANLPLTWVSTEVGNQHRPQTESKTKTALKSILCLLEMFETVMLTRKLSSEGRCTCTPHTTDLYK